MTTIGNWIIEAQKRLELPAVQYKEKNRWQTLTWANYIQKVISAYLHLNAKGLKPKTHVALMASTCWEWAAIDLAVLGGGGVLVPVYPNINDDECCFILENSDAEIFIVENNKQFLQFEKIKSRLTKKIEILLLSEVQFQHEPTESETETFFQLCRNLKPEQIATIIYTSGTTGQPKGAVLQHQAIVSEVQDAFERFAVKPDYKSLTFLPFAHVLGRIEGWGSCLKGHCIAYAESIERIRLNIKEVKPDFIIGVPRIFEKIYSAVLTEVETKNYKQKIFEQALDISNEIQKYRSTKEMIPWGLLLKYQILNQVAFAPIRKAFGGNLKMCICGGAPISEELIRFFMNCGIPILEGYGLTETCAAVSVNTLSQFQPGTVGIPIGDVQIRIAEDGEILIKSQKCMLEYYKNEAETKKAFVDSYFATGDIGHITELGFLQITDRKKDLIKTAGGKYVAPQKLENLIKQDPLVSHVLIHGDQKKYIVALITLDNAQLLAWSKNQNLNVDLTEDLHQNPSLQTRIQKHIQQINSKLSSFETIKKFQILPDEWSLENGSLTPSLKLKRKFLESKYTDTLLKLY